MGCIWAVRILGQSGNIPLLLYCKRFGTGELLLGIILDQSFSNKIVGILSKSENFCMKLLKNIQYVLYFKVDVWNGTKKLRSKLFR